MVKLDSYSVLDYRKLVLNYNWIRLLMYRVTQSKWYSFKNS